MRNGLLLAAATLVVLVVSGVAMRSGPVPEDLRPSLPSTLGDEPRRLAAAQAAVQRFAVVYGRYATGQATASQLRASGASDGLVKRLERAGGRIPPGLASARFQPQRAEVYPDPSDPARIVGNISLLDQDGTRLPLSVELAERGGRWEVVDVLAGGDDL